MNTVSNMCKLFYFNLTVSSLYLVKLKKHKNSRLLTAVRFLERIALEFRRESFNDRFSLFVRKFLSQSTYRKSVTFSYVFMNNLSSDAML